MSDSSVQVVCSACGEVFTSFLEDMADHNQAVVCPKCRQVHEQRLGHHAADHKDRR